jgi:hypothetical protein
VFQSWTHLNPNRFGLLLQHVAGTTTSSGSNLLQPWLDMPPMVNLPSNKCLFFSVKQTEQMTIKQDFFGESPKQITINFPV